MPSLKKELFVSVDSGKLFCCLFGKKESSPIIVLHGGPGLGQGYLLPQMAKLGTFSYAIFYDQRGTGQSKSTDDWQSNPIKTYIEDINQLRQWLQLNTISLLGHSWGGLLASAYASAYPHHIDKLIYLNSVPLSNTSYLEFVKHRTQLVDKNKSVLDSLRESKAFAEGDPKTIETFYRIYFKNYFAKPMLADKLTLAMTPEAAINNFKIYDLFYNYTKTHSFDFYKSLKNFNKPTLIIASDGDVIPLDYQERLHQSIPSSKFVLIKNCGHFPYIDEPTILFKTLRDFMKENPSGSN